MSDNQYHAPRSSEIVLEGLDGANPLAFLASLGALRGLSIAWPERSVRMSWVELDAWRPCLHVDAPSLNQGDILDGLVAFAEMRPGHDALGIGDNLNLPPDQFREAAMDAAETSALSLEGRSQADFIAGFACDAITGRGGLVQDTALRTMQGAGHQHFLKTMLLLSEKVGTDKLRQSLFQPWQRRDPQLSLRWDPEEDRQYALRWTDPSTDQVSAKGEKSGAPTEWGANRLAFEAIPLLPVAPVGSNLITTGFRGSRANDTWFTWPIWDALANVDMVRSILAIKELRENVPNRNKLAPVGVREIFRSQRLNSRHYRNFSPAMSV